MKKVFFICATLSFFAAACSNTPQSPKGGSDDTMQSFKDEHTAKNSLDWMGTYEGVLPCADCEGIRTTIILKEDGTFSSLEEYLKEPNVLVESTGKFTWDASGMKVILKDEKDFNRTFKVVENAIIHLDMEGNEITGALAEHYRLSKK